MNEKQILELIYVKKNYSEIKEILKDSSDFRSFNILAKIYLWEGEIDEAYKYFKNAKSIIGCCYCLLLKDDIKGAKVLINLVKGSSSVINWLNSLINLMEDKEERYPSYFEIRNFYEQDLELFFKYKKNDYVNKIINKIHYFEHFNREIYKYTGRVFLNNNLIEEAQYMLKKSLEIYYNDPETHFLLGELHLRKEEKNKAKEEFKKSEEVTGGYLPASKKLKDLSN